MKTTYRWLQDYCKFDLSPEELCEVLTNAGLEVEALHPVGDDYCIEMEITSNRPDLLGTIGIARELSAATGVPLQIPDVTCAESDLGVTDLAQVEVVAEDLCPRYTARVLTDVRVGPSPSWLTSRLEAIGLRPVNNVVDITNYVLMECAQPLHAFDLDKLRDQKIVVRRAAPGEKVTAIDHTEYALTDDLLVIADSARPTAVAGVMGGLETEMADGTTRVLLESAQFDPGIVRTACRKLGLGSDSSYRFERGVDPVGVDWASRRAALLLVQLADAKLAKGVLDVGAPDLEPRRVSLRIPRCNEILGTEIDAEEAAGMLGSLGFEILETGRDALHVAVPTFRREVTREVDLIEEVARIYGYDKIPITIELPVDMEPRPRPDEVERLTREVLVGLGYHESLTSSFASEGVAQKCCPWPGRIPVSLVNPVRAEENFLRTSLLHGLLAAKQLNTRRGNASSPLFEISKSYFRSEEGGDPAETRTLTILDDSSVLDLKGSIETLLQRLGLSGRYTVREVQVPSLEPGKSAEVVLDDAVIGYFGELEGGLAAQYGVDAWLCELDFDAISQCVSLQKTYRAVPRFPAVNRDVAIVVDESVPWAQLVDAMGSAAPPILEDIRFFDCYTGKQVPPGKKSLAFTLVFRSPDRTLLGEEAADAQQAIVAELERRFGATLRA